MRNPPLLLVGSVKIDLIRTTAGTHVRGRPVPGDSYLVPIVCNIQPIEKSSDTRLIPEGDRSKAAIKVYSRGDQIRQLREGAGGWAADRFYWQGDLYEVMKVINFEMGVLSHFKAICMRVELT
jgi:hypothetical protein